MSIEASIPATASPSKLSSEDPQQHIILVDDDEATLNMVRMLLEKRGHRVTVARNGQQALELIRKFTPDLILLDLMMPKVDGMQICRTVRANTDTPIIVISAIELEERKVELLDLGADDYLTKPFGLEELMARIRAVMRRSREANMRQIPRVHIGGLVVDFKARSVFVNDEHAHLTPTEFKLLAEFVKRPGEILTHEHLLSSVWGNSYTDSVEYLHIYIGRLRKKLANLENVTLQTLTGTGYALVTEGV